MEHRFPPVSSWAGQQHRPLSPVAYLDSLYSQNREHLHCKRWYLHALVKTSALRSCPRPRKSQNRPNQDFFAPIHSHSIGSLWKSSKPSFDQF